MFKLKSDYFWIILRAIREFTYNEGLGQLPVNIFKRKKFYVKSNLKLNFKKLRGSIPDMVRY